MNRALNKKLCRADEAFWHRGYDPDSEILSVPQNESAAPAFHQFNSTHSSNFVLQFRWLSPKPGQFLKVLLVQTDRFGNILKQSQRAIEPNYDGPNAVAFGLDENCHDIVGQVSQAFVSEDSLAEAETKLEKDAIDIDRIQTFFVKNSQNSYVCQPMGVVGLSYCDPNEIPALLAEMLTHYEHYRKSAEVFSYDWFARHDPNCTLGQIMGTSIVGQKKVA